MTIKKTLRYKNTGSVLLYVLWILVVITLLAFKLSSASRVVMIKQVSQASQIKKNLQIKSATQFAIFKIIKDDWSNQKFELNLNGQQMLIEIYNESGFISLYDLSSQSLKNVIESSSIASTALDDLNSQLDENKIKFNDFMELIQIEGISAQDVRQLIPYVSIYHQESVNPLQSPAEVLFMLQGVDTYRVNKLIESTDNNEKTLLRSEIVEILRSGRESYSEAMSDYFRVYISLDGDLYRVFLKQKRRSDDFLVVNTLNPVETPN